jgi:glycosyltransferase involved in cell wall biosynthesis
VFHQESQGLSITRNNGLQAASGEYIYFLDSDDWIENNTLKLLLQEMQKESADVVFMDANSFSDEKERAIEQRYFRKKRHKADKGIRVLSELMEEKEYHSSVPLLFMSAEFIKRNSLCFIPEIVYEDMIFTYEVFLKAERVSHVNAALYQRRYRSNSIMTSKKKAKDYVSAKTVYEKVHAYVSEEEVTKQYVIRCALNVLNMYKKLTLQEQKEYKEDYKELKRNILANNAYGHQALKMRCYGVGVWFCYKVFEKIFKK